MEKKLCDYGCGREAKYQFKNGKWCCSEYFTQCPTQRNKNSKFRYGIYYNNNSNELCDYGCGQKAKYQFKNGKKCCSIHTNKCPINKRRASNKSKDLWKIPEIKNKYRKSQNNPKTKIKRSKSIKESWKDLKVRKARIKGLNNPETKSNRIKKIKGKNKITIEQIKERYPTFSKEEEMRYNPDKLKEKEIQVHCKYSGCQNSKEKGGWFTPMGREIGLRFEALESNRGNDGSYIYCSKRCKQSCCLYYLNSDPHTRKEYEKYHWYTDKETNITLKRYSNKIKNIELQGKKYGYSLDHKYSVYDGFKNNVDPKIIGHWKNLECIPELENLKKNKNSSITLEKLKEQIIKHSTGPYIEEFLNNG